MNISSLRGGLALALLSLCLAACTQTRDLKSSDTSFAWSSGPQKRIVLVQPDLVLSELTAGGLAEPRADWTGAARDFVTKDIAATLGQASIDVTELDTLSNPHDIQLAQLHNAV